MLLAVPPAKSDPNNHADPFVGGWVLIVTSKGEEISKGQIAPAALKISKKDAFYNVSLEIPSFIDSSEDNNTGFSWDSYLKASEKSLQNLSIALATEKYSGKYLLNDDEKSITHLDGSITIQYRKAAKMICEKGLGCFKKGDQSELIKRYQAQLAIAEAGAKAKAKAKAEAKAEAEAKAAAEAEVVRAKAFNGPYSEMTWDDAVAYCSSNGGRLPNTNELKNIHKNECGGDGSDTPNTCDFWFWSSEKGSVGHTFLGIVSNYTDHLSHVRCVKGEAPAEQDQAIPAATPDNGGNTILLKHRRH